MALLGPLLSLIVCGGRLGRTVVYPMAASREVDLLVVVMVVMVMVVGAEAPSVTVVAAGVDQHVMVVMVRTGGFGADLLQ